MSTNLREDGHLPVDKYENDLLFQIIKQNFIPLDREEITKICDHFHDEFDHIIQSNSQWNGSLFHSHNSSCINYELNDHNYLNAHNSMICFDLGSRQNVKSLRKQKIFYMMDTFSIELHTKKLREIMIKEVVHNFFNEYHEYLDFSIDEYYDRVSQIVGFLLNFDVISMYYVHNIVAMHCENISARLRDHLENKLVCDIEKMIEEVDMKNISTIVKNNDNYIHLFLKYKRMDIFSKLKIMVFAYNIDNY